MLIAYLMFGHDNGAFFFKDAPPTIFCPQCDSCLDTSCVPQKMKIPKKYDFGSTYDNRKIVSSRFKEFCEEYYPGEVDFQPVTSKEDFFLFSPRRIVEFDTEKRKTNFNKLCSACGQFHEVVGVSPGVLKNITEPIELGFYRTDTAFGSNRGKSPVVVVGIKTKVHITKMRFTKPDFAPAYDEMPPKNQT